MWLAICIVHRTDGPAGAMVGAAVQCSVSALSTAAATVGFVTDGEIGTDNHSEYPACGGATTQVSELLWEPSLNC